MQFKKGDIVRCVDAKDPEHHNLKLNRVYIVDNMSDDLLFVQLSKYNNYNNIYSTTFGYYPYRFKRISSNEMSEKEAFEYIKYKLGV